MKIRIVGAAGGEVTGSAYHVQTEHARVLVDAGMFQGGKKSQAKNRLPSGVNLSKLDAVLLTHAHLDHTGRVPLLIKHGYNGRIYGTTATLELAELILEDSARLQVHEAERANRTRNFSLQGPVEPLYSPEDVVPFMFTPLAASRPQIIITHGEDTPRKKLSAAIQERFGLRSQLPSQGSILEISAPIIASQALA